MRRLAWLLCGLALLAVWAFYPSAWAAVLLAVLVLTPPVSWLLLQPGRNRAGLELDAPGLCAKDQRFPVRVTLCRSGGFPAGYAAAVLRAENAVTGETVRLRLTLSPEGVCELRSAYCGCLRLEVESVCLYDVFGVLPVKLPCKAARKTVILPNTFPVEVAPISSDTSLLDAQEYAQDRKGQDRSETFQIREYVPGDNLSQIHWKLSGKQERLMVRESACPVDHTLSVFLDRFQGDAPPEWADALMEAVISVCQGLSEAGISFRVYWKEEHIHTEDVTQPDQLPALVGLLLSARPGEKGTARQELPAGSAYEKRSVLYFGTRMPGESDISGIGSILHMFLCMPEPFDAPDVTAFTPETVEDALREVNWSGYR